MPLWLKITLGVVAGFVALLAIIGFALFSYVRAHKTELLAAGKQAMESGEAFGRSSDQRGCVDEGFRRLQTLGGITEEITNNLFEAGCLQVAPPSTGFCDDVPEEMSILKTVAWRTQVCAAHSNVDPQRCQRFLQTWQKQCHGDAK